MKNNEKKLIELGERMNAQDNRATQFPLFVVQELVTKPSHEDYCDAYVLLNEENGEMDAEDLCEDCEDEEDRIEPCVSCNFKRRLPVTETYEFNLNHGVFLTSEECDSYIKRRSYAMGKNARSYGISAHRSGEMTQVLEFLSTLGSGNGKAKNWYR